MSSSTIRSMSPSVMVTARRIARSGDARDVVALGRLHRQPDQLPRHREAVRHHDQRIGLQIPAAAQSGESSRRFHVVEHALAEIADVARQPARDQIERVARGNDRLDVLDRVQRVAASRSASTSSAAPSRPTGRRRAWSACAPRRRPETNAPANPAARVSPPASARLTSSQYDLASSGARSREIHVQIGSSVARAIRPGALRSPWTSMRNGSSGRKNGARGRAEARRALAGVAHRGAQPPATACRRREPRRRAAPRARAPS